jgi:hypothetical protein
MGRGCVSIEGAKKIEDDACVSIERFGLATGGLSGGASTKIGARILGIAARGAVVEVTGLLTFGSLAIYTIGGCFGR